MNPTDLLELPKYGTAGVMIGMLVLIAIVIRYYHKLSTNHIEHSNDIFRDNTEALAKLSRAIDDDIKVTKELKEEISCLRRSNN